MFMICYRHFYCQSATIINTVAEGMMEKIHPRMPVVLNPSVYEAWLNPQITSKSDLDISIDKVQLSLTEIQMWNREEQMWKISVESVDDYLWGANGELEKYAN